MADSATQDSEFDERVINSAALLGTAVDSKALIEMTEKLVSVFLQRPDDAEVLNQTLRQVRAFFGTPKVPMDVLRQFSVQVIRVVLRSRPAEYYQAMLDAEAPDPDAVLPPGAPEPHHAPTELVLVPPPKPVTCASFEELVVEGLCYKLRVITTFFHRRNPLMARGVKPPYLLSPAFEGRLCQVVREIIAPMMFRQKTLGAMGSARHWRDISTAALWQRPDLHEDLLKIVKAWEGVWLKLHHSERAHHHPPTVKLSPAEQHAMARDRQTLMEIQHMLTGPEYTLPKLGMAQIKVFQTFLTNFDRPVMEQVWKGLRQTYEQELDRRSYQQQARYGALRDAFLTSFDLCTNSIGELLVILAYYSLPRLSLYWVEKFTHNLGSTHDDRAHLIPVLMRFLAQDDAVAAAKREPVKNLAAMTASACHDE